MTADEITVKLLTARRHRLYIVANTLRHEAANLVEAFVDPEYGAELLEQRAADRAWVAAANARTRDLLADTDETCGF